ncbi:MAG: thioredoxin domain-containing protein, partial [Candidatus Dormibacteria bacterium]
IKVDREERPDVDKIYMEAVQALTQNGGWPMTVFLTPEAVPFFGGTYFPPEDRQGMRGFPYILRAAAQTYRDRRSDVEAAGARLRQALDTPRIRGDAEPHTEHLERATSTLIAQADTREGGFGSGPKFPHAAALDLLLRRHRLSGDPRPRETAILALDRMARGGIHDQIGGGFHRYSVDGRWAVPHFEKMLYDNALVVPPYLHAYQLDGDPRWREVVEGTLDYVVREMRLEEGGFASSQDADSEGEEGVFFVWTPAQLHEVLGGDDGDLACEVFGVDGAGNFEGGTTVLAVPRPLTVIAAERGIEARELAQWLHGIRVRLFEARGARVAPARDDKVITSWNALMLRAFAEAGPALDRPDYVAVARDNADFLLDQLMSGGVLLRTWKSGEAKITAFLEDVAYLAEALLVLYEATGEPRFFHHGRQLCDDMMRRFHAPGEGLYDTAEGSEPLLVRPFTLDDNPIPAGQSIAAQAFLRLAAFTGEGAWRDRGLEIVRPLASAVARAPLALPNLAAALDLALSVPREIAIAGTPDGDDTVELVRTVTSLYDPVRVLAWGPPDEVPLLQERPAVEGRATAYVCERFLCRAPVRSAQELKRLLEGRDHS